MVQQPHPLFGRAAALARWSSHNAGATRARRAAAMHGCAVDDDDDASVGVCVCGFCVCGGGLLCSRCGDDVSQQAQWWDSVENWKNEESVLKRY